jgi:hypothetical protein
MELIALVVGVAAAVSDGPSSSPPDSPVSKPAAQTAQDRILESAGEHRLPGARLRDCIYSCYPEAAAEDDDDLDGEDAYCGSCWSLAVIFAPFKSCWDALVNCLLCLWQSFCPCLQSDITKAQNFLIKWSAVEKPPKRMDPAARLKIATQWANDFMALPVEFQMKAFSSDFKLAHPTAFIKNLNKPENRRAVALEHPVSNTMLQGIKATLAQKLLEQQQKSEIARK